RWSYRETAPRFTISKAMAIRRRPFSFASKVSGRCGSRCRAPVHLDRDRKTALQHLGCWHLHIPCEAAQGHGANHQVAHVKLPPAKTVSSRGRERVVVVPAFAKCQYSQNQVITTLVLARKRLAAP